MKAQTPNWEWARGAQTHSGNTAYSQGLKIASDFSDNVFITGWYYASVISFDSINAYPNDSTNFRNIFIAKYNSNGDVMWAKSPGGAGYSMGVATDHNGNSLITGGFIDTVIFDLDTLIWPYTFGGALFLAKYDSTGNIMWAKRNGGNYFSSARAASVATDKNANVFITGYFNDPYVSFDSIVLNGMGGSNNIFIAKYDSAGNALWAKSGLATNQTEVNTIICDTSGNSYISGYFFSPSIVFDTDTLFAQSAVTINSFFVKYDSSGNLVWAKSGNATGDWGSSITTDRKNNVYLSGRFDAPSISFGYDTLLFTGNNLNYNSYLAKLDSSGNAIWAKKFDGGFACDMVTDSIDNIYISGSTYISTFGYVNDSITFDTISIALTGSSDEMFIVKYDSSGHVQWAKVLIGGGDGINSISLGRNGNIYIGGDFFISNSQTHFILGNDTLIRTGIEDAFIAKMNYSNSTAIPVASEKSEFITYPNPFNSYLNFYCTNSDIYKLTIYDITSRKLLRQNFIHSVVINTDQFAKGIYLYEARNKNGLSKKGKLVKD